MRALVILADADEVSLCRAAAARVGHALERAGHTVTLRDLHAEGFGVAMTADERRAYHSDEPILDPLVAQHAVDVRDAGLLVFVYPTVLSTVPAQLKGWLERVLVTGVGFVFNERHKVRPGLGHVRRIVGISTYTEGRLEIKVTRDNGRRIIVRAPRMSTGLTTRTTWLPLYSVGTATPERQEAFIARCEGRVARR